MSDITIDGILEGTPHKVAVAYLNTLRRLYNEIEPKVRNIDSRLGRITDEYYAPSIWDGIAVGREVTGLLYTMKSMSKVLGKLEESVARLADKKAVTK